MAVTAGARVPVREQSARRLLAIAATLGVLGIAFNLNNEDQLMPKVLAVAGVLALVWSIHRFGRLGPDEIIVFEEPPAPPLAKKKKKKKRPVEEAAVGTAPQVSSKPTPDDSDPH
jgi:hypothetical protein